MFSCVFMCVLRYVSLSGVISQRVFAYMCLMSSWRSNPQPPKQNKNIYTYIYIYIWRCLFCSGELLLYKPCTTARFWKTHVNHKNCLFQKYKNGFFQKYKSCFFWTYKNFDQLKWPHYTIKTKSWFDPKNQDSGQNRFCTKNVVCSDGPSAHFGCSGFSDRPKKNHVFTFLVVLFDRAMSI